MFVRNVGQASGVNRFADEARPAAELPADEEPPHAADHGGDAIATVLRIAANVFKESVRDKVLYGIVLFAVLIISASMLLGQLTAGQEVKIIKDLGLAAISLFGHFIAIFIGIGLVSKEVERRSIYALLAKPMTRSQLLLGKYLRAGLDAGRQRHGDDRRAALPCSRCTRR